MYLHVARAKIHLEIHGGVPRGRGAVLAVWWRQMMRMKGVQLRRVELMMKRGLMITAAEGVPPRLVPRAAAGGAAAPRATPAAAAGTDPQDATAASATDAAATARPSARCELVRAGFNLSPDRSACT